MNCWSWEGEDILARKIMRDVFKVERGFYVDIGAHHPFNLSNTAILYEEGWRGINIDAEPGSMELFRQHRPEDVNLEIAIAPASGRRTFTRFTDPGLNGFVRENAIRYHQLRGSTVIEQVEVECRPLNTVLEEHADGRRIDLMNIDAEGLDYEILASLDMNRWRPAVIITEVLGCSFMEDVVRKPVASLLAERGYGLFSRLHFSCLFVDRAAYARL